MKIFSPTFLHNRKSTPSAIVSAIPIAMLFVAMLALILLRGAWAVQENAAWLLLMASLVAYLLSFATTRRPGRLLKLGMVKSARQILPAFPLLLLIGLLSTTWMLSGVVPLMVSFGVSILHPTFFLVIACVVCAAVSVATGSSWTTVATLGVAFIGIGRVMGFSEAWIAGAIISGAYFGDKVSPLSDTTVLAASSCGLDLFRHIRFLMLTSIPAMVVALVVYGVVGVASSREAVAPPSHIVDALESMFNLSPWLLVIPALTALMILLRFNSNVTLSVGAAAGLAGIWIFQPAVVDALNPSGGFMSGLLATAEMLLGGFSLDFADASVGELVSTSGIKGMLPTVALVACSMVLGGAMIGTGMLQSLTRSFTHLLRRPRSLVGATVASGLFLNGCTGDQYLSIIIGGNIYRATYRRNDLADEMLSRSLEDSVSVTSVLIPWNSCGVTQSTVLGVATLAYLPCCVFNLMSPVLSVLYSWVGFKIRHREPRTECKVAVVGA